MKEKDWFEKSSDEYWSDFLDRQKRNAPDHRFDEPEPPPPERRKSKAEYARKNREELARSNPSYQYPSVTVSRTVKGDIDYAARFRGEADKLLYDVKNRKALGQLDQLWGQRSFSDGTVIKVKSIFGQDYVEIDTTLSTEVGEAMPTCSITFINLPLAVAPMKWYPDGIHTWPDGRVEVEGVDYYKTYYKVESLHGTEYVEWRPCDTETLMADFGFGVGMTNCHPFTYHDDSVPVTTETWRGPDSHCIWSTSTCGGEVYSWGSDSGGRYFIWKAFTEWSMLGPYAIYYPPSFGFVRAGLGYMQVGLKITNQGGALRCENYGIVKVDCCLKPAINRSSTMYWQWGAFGGPFIIYGTQKFWPVPPKVSADWICSGYQTVQGHVPMHFFPEMLGACGPITWSQSGGIDLEISGILNGSVGFRIPHAPGGIPYGGYVPCRYRGKVKGTTRCNESDEIEMVGCCYQSEFDPNSKSDKFEIEITSYIMHCGETQGLGPSGTGCPPYHFSLDGVGTISAEISSGDGIYYTAPATYSGGCETAATVTVTDCCGASASVSLTLQCWTGDQDAFVSNAFESGGNWGSYCGSAPCKYVYGTTSQGYFTVYDCDGGINQDYIYAGGYAICSRPGLSPCGIAAGAAGGLYCLCGGSGCPDDPDICCVPTPANMYHDYFKINKPSYDCDTVYDLRTAAMIAAGCCPINPLTGLPFAAHD